MSAVLRVSGSFNDLSPVIKTSDHPFKESIKSRKERERSPEDYAFVTTYNLTISEADGGMVPLQIEQASKFISEHKNLFFHLNSTSSKFNLSIDFMWEFPTSTIGQFNRFDAELISLCHEHNIELEVSVYACSD